MPRHRPAGVDVVFKEDHINVKGALGTLAQAQNALVTITNEAAS
jgi:large subunit ribosomal protein L6